MNFVEKLLDRLLDKRVIVNCERKPYLHRWYLVRKDWLGIFVHKFVRSDEDRALHDHPWDFIVIPIWRGYIEHSESGHHYINSDGEKVPMNQTHRVYPVLGTRFRRGTYRHRVELLKHSMKVRLGPALNYRKATWSNGNEMPAWSIFIRFRKFRDWGFWLPEGFIQWNKWWQDKCGGDE